MATPAPDQDKLNEIPTISQDTNELSAKIATWIKDGEKLRKEVAEIDKRLLTAFRVEVAKPKETE